MQPIYWLPGSLTIRSFWTAVMPPPSYKLPLSCKWTEFSTSALNSWRQASTRPMWSRSSTSQSRYGTVLLRTSSVNNRKYWTKYSDARETYHCPWFWLACRLQFTNSLTHYNQLGLLGFGEVCKAGIEQHSEAIFNDPKTFTQISLEALHEILQSYGTLSLTSSVTTLIVIILWFAMHPCRLLTHYHAARIWLWLRKSFGRDLSIGARLKHPLQRTLQMWVAVCLHTSIDNQRCLSSCCFNSADINHDGSGCFANRLFV